VDLDLAFVSALLSEGGDGWRRAVEKGIRAEDLSGEGRQVYDYTHEHLQLYGTMPAADIVGARLSIELPKPQDSVLFFSDEINNRKLHSALQGGVSSIATRLRDGKPQDAYIALEELVSKLRKEQVVGSRVRPFADTLDEAWAFYERLKAGETGVLTPWATLNEATLGFWPEDLIIVAARQGVGKSWLALIMAMHAWLSGKRVLFATTEMAQMAISMRFIALHQKLAFNSFRHGKLGIFAEEKVLKNLEDLKQAEGLWIIGGNFDFRTDSLDAAIEEVQPDLTIADGAYLLDAPDSGTTRTDKAAAAFNELKRIAKRRKTAVLATTQFNRSASNDKSGSIKLENIGLTDVVGWNADLAIGLIQSDDMRTDKQMGVKPLKVREGFCRDFTLQWDLETMDFREILATDPAADEFGTAMSTPPSMGTALNFSPGTTAGASTGTEPGELF